MRLLDGEGGLFCHCWCPLRLWPGAMLGACLLSKTKLFWKPERQETARGESCRARGGTGADAEEL